MKRLIVILISSILLLAGCSQSTNNSEQNKQNVKIGIMLSDVGLGDQSFSDSAFAGLEKARDELGIIFDYREISDTKNYEDGLTELVEDGNDLVIGLGFIMKEAVENVAAKYSDQKFLLIDDISELPNVYNVTFKEHEGSFLLGVIAGLKTKSNVVGFIGGVDVPLINKFRAGFEQGVKEVNPDAQVLVEFVGNFDDDNKGYALAAGMIDKGADFVYPAAGFAGVGAIQAAQAKGVYAFGVDSDQYFLAEDTIVSSMLKKIDVAMFEVAEQLVETGEITEKNLLLGIAESGVDVAPIRVLELNQTELDQFNDLKQNVSQGIKSIKEQ
ncbi:BMP family lipoprotein [Ferdinandcohnia quinoae]|uniref:BMP family ABC transporter substrate-binding protein n=1 Tax=Fredinandcohnia quinoae TaxID=2918902 RepID=A0AAW5E4V4_9BACI|nr:BMP family ABC transporter substrate-binding protein [Fredinandcohnia sp. SECRCQ15]MCH1624386.1 BMP family ABC transporter substrate-binding protein [Fredinandcohnia sp. SECRCQ15]